MKVTKMQQFVASIYVPNIRSVACTEVVFIRKWFATASKIALMVLTKIQICARLLIAKVKNAHNINAGWLMNWLFFFFIYLIVILYIDTYIKIQINYLFSIYVGTKNLHVRIDSSVYQWLKYAMVLDTAQIHLMKIQKCAKYVSMYFKNIQFNPIKYCFNFLLVNSSS